VKTGLDRKASRNHQGIIPTTASATSHGSRGNQFHIPRFYHRIGVIPEDISRRQRKAPLDDRFVASGRLPIITNFSDDQIRE
jgi:hypothetical protein